MSGTGTGCVEAEATVSWAGWSGEVRGASGKLNALTATQVELGGPGHATNPEELLAAALANCYTSTIAAHARSRKIDLAHIETKARTRLAWDEATPHHIAQGTLAVGIRSSALELEVRKLAQDARDHCPICNVLGATTEVTLTVSMLPADPLIGGTGDGEGAAANRLIPNYFGTPTFCKRSNTEV